MIVLEKPRYETSGQTANRLAVTIQRFWKDLGHNVDVRVRETTVNGRPVHVLESDLVNGLPPGYAGSLRHLPVIRERPVPPDTSAVRDCMTCGKSFKSEGIDNRMCDYCRSK